MSKALMINTRRSCAKRKDLPRRPQPIKFDARALFNQAFKSVYAMVPGDIMLLLILIPSMLTALSVVREKELGSIANFYAAPATRLEFLLGKQLPYLRCRAGPVRDAGGAGDLVSSSVPMKGSWATLVLGGVIYVLASTGFGLLISVFAPTQTAAIFAAAIITILPAVQFSGMFVPVSSLTGAPGSPRGSSPAPTSRQSVSARSPRRSDSPRCGEISPRLDLSLSSTSASRSRCWKSRRT